MAKWKKLNLGRDVPRLVRLFRYSLGLIKLSPSFFMVGNWKKKKISHV